MRPLRFETETSKCVRKTTANRESCQESANVVELGRLANSLISFQYMDVEENSVKLSTIGANKLIFQQSNAWGDDIATPSSKY